MLLQLHLLRALLAISAAASASGVVSQSPSGGSGGNGGRCGEWSAWESRAWGGATRLRETCGDGRLDEQCRSGLGLITTCRLADSEGKGVNIGDSAPSAPQFDARRPAAKNFVYRSYYYVPTYSYSYSRVTYVCSVGCIIGAAIGAVISIGSLIAGIIVLYCLCFRSRPRGGIIRPSVATTTTTATTVVATPASNMVTVYPTYGNPAFDTAAYPNAYPNTYPPMYPGMEQHYNPATTYPPPPYPINSPPPSYQ